MTAGDGYRSKGRSRAQRAAHRGEPRSPDVVSPGFVARGRAPDARRVTRGTAQVRGAKEESKWADAMAPRRRAIPVPKGMPKGSLPPHTLPVSAKKTRVG